jgi:hypothetical protein
MSEETTTCPSFAPYFDVNTPLPAERSPDYKGYMLGLKDTVYHAHPALNASTLKHRTPAEMLHSMTNPSEVSHEALALGTVVHWATLEQWRFKEWEKHMIICRTKGLDTQKADIDRAENPDRLVVTPEIVETAHRCLDAVQANATAMALLDGRDPEDSYGTKSPVTSEATGLYWDGVIWRKWRVDLLPQKLPVLIDVKSTRAHPSEWRKECFKLGYYEQAVYYAHNHFLLTGEWRDWAWIVVTNKAPFMCRVVRMRNLRKSDPLYEESIWRSTREKLGLDDSLRIGRIPQFIAAAQETEAMRARVKLTPAVLRSIWVGYEQESPIHEIIV